MKLFCVPSYICAKKHSVLPLPLCIIPAFCLSRHVYCVIVIVIVIVLSSCGIFVQALEPASLAVQQLVRAAVLDELTLVHDYDLVEVEDGVELVRDGDEGVVGESGAKEALDVGVACSIETKALLLVLSIEQGMCGELTC